MGIGLGLGAALCWGFADYFATLASRRAGTLRVVLGFHLIATAVLAALVLGTGALADVSLGDVAPFLLLGALGWASYLAFYRALAIGPISIVSPVVSGYAAVTVVLAVLVVATAARGGRWRFPDRSPRLLAAIGLIALLDTGGYVSFNVGSRHADTAIVAAAASPDAGGPLVLGGGLLAERPARAQWAGIALVIAGLVLLALSS